MLKLFDFKWDKRTFWNIYRSPFILFISIPISVMFWVISWINDWSDTVIDKLPYWKTR